MNATGRVVGHDFSKIDFQDTSPVRREIVDLVVAGVIGEPTRASRLKQKIV